MRVLQQQRRNCKPAICILQFSIVLAGATAASVFAATAARAESAREITPDVVYGHKAGMALTLDVIRPKEPNGAGVMFMMSGGWFSIWVPPETLLSDEARPHFRHFNELLDRGYTLFVVRHGSAPQFKVPDAVADVRRAARFVRLNADKFGIDSERIGVCGGSAGGHLSLMLGTTSDDGNQDAVDPVDRASNRVAAVVAYFPPVMVAELFDLKDRFPALDFDPKLAGSVSPLLHVTPDDAPTLLVHGDKDDLVKLDNSERILAKLKEQNVPCELLVIEGAGHGFPGEMGQRASQSLVAWFDDHLATTDRVQPKGEQVESAASGR